VTKNIGNTDKLIRIIAGTLFLLAGIFADTALGLAIGFIVLAALAYTTAYVRF